MPIDCEELSAPKQHWIIMVQKQDKPNHYQLFGESIARIAKLTQHERVRTLVIVTQPELAL